MALRARESAQKPRAQSCASAWPLWRHLSAVSGIHASCVRFAKLLVSWSVTSRPHAHCMWPHGTLAEVTVALSWFQSALLGVYEARLTCGSKLTFATIFLEYCLNESSNLSYYTCLVKNAFMFCLLHCPRIIVLIQVIFMLIFQAGSGQRCLMPCKNKDKSHPQGTFPYGPRDRVCSSRRNFSNP